MTLYTQERAVAVAAVIKACQLCSKVQRRLTADHKMAKADTSPVTVADFGAQALIIAELLRAFPNDHIVGEEDATALRQPEQQALKAQVVAFVNEIAPTFTEAAILDAIDDGAKTCDFTQRYWTLDPVDGTKGFLRGEQYAVALALIEHGEPVVGVLGCPNLAVDHTDSTKGAGALFVAVKGQGAFLRALTDATETPIHVAGAAAAAYLRFCDSVEAEHASHDDHAKIAKLLGITTPAYRIDSQGKYGVVARGEAAIYLRLTKKDYRSWIWDHAAGVIVVHEAGGKVTDIYGKPLDFSVGRRLLNNVGVIATNGALHDNLLKAIERIR